MSLKIFENKGCPLNKQLMTLKEMERLPISKTDDDAFTRVMVILMNGIELESIQFSRACARINGDMQIPHRAVLRDQMT